MEELSKVLHKTCSVLHMNIMPDLRDRLDLCRREEILNQGKMLTAQVTGFTPANE